MTIVVTGPPAAPVVNAVAGTGGSLAAGTYYVRVCSKRTNSYTSSVSGSEKSPPSAEVSCAVDGVTTNAIDLSWAAVPTAAAYNVYVRKSTEPDYTGNKHKAVSTTATTTTSTTYKLTSVVTEMNVPMDFVAWNPTLYPIPGCPSDVRELGQIDVHLSGACGTVSYENVKAAVDAAGYANYMWTDGWTIFLKGHLTVDSGATGTINFYQWASSPVFTFNTRLCFLDGGHANNATSTFTVNASNSDGSKALELQLFAWSWSWSVPNGKAINHIVRGGSWGSLPTVTIIGGGDDGCWLASTSGDATGLVVQCGKLNAAKDVTDVTGTGIFSSFFSNAVHTRVKCGNYFFVYGSYSNTKYIECVSKYNSTYWLRVLWANDPIKFLNCTFANNTTSSWKLGVDGIWWNDAAGIGTRVYCGFTFDMQVMTNGGVPVSGANVQVTDVTGATVFSVSTGGDGKIASQEVYPYVYTHDPAYPPSGYKSIETKTSPFTMTVVAAGYDTYLATIDPVAKVNGYVILETTALPAAWQPELEELQLNWQAAEPEVGFEPEDMEPSWKVGGPQ